MVRAKNGRKDVAAAFIAAAVLFLLTFGSASGEGTAIENPSSSEMTSTSPSCTIDLQSPEPVFLSLDGGACRADAASEVFLSNRPQRPKSCRCSCGAPCQTDADCGGAPGSCRVGVTCC